MLEVHRLVIVVVLQALLLLLEHVLSVGELALKRLGIPFKYVEFGLLDQVCELLHVFTAAATALRAAVDPFGETLTVEL